MTGDVRKMALDVLNSLDLRRSTLDHALDAVAAKNPLFSRRERAFLNMLVYGVLRWRNRLDWIIAFFSTTRKDKIDPSILNILRLGVFQIIYLDRIPVSAAVNTSVEIAKQCAGPWVVRYVNALLRHVVRSYLKVPFPDPSQDPAGAVSVDKSLPEWLTRRWLDRFGLPETESLCDAINAIAPLTIRTNTLKTTRKTLMASLQKDVEKIECTAYAPEGLNCINPIKPVYELKPFLDGWFQVQDEAAQLISLVLNPQPGETILDACAGRGGKTGHLAQLMKNRGRIVAMDDHPDRLRQLEMEMRRLGIDIVSPFRHDLNHPLDKRFQGVFDRVLLDAPCSGLGVLRRNPDTKWSMSPSRFEHYREKQKRFLHTLSSALKPSGTLVYSVCSIEPEENEEVVKDFLNQHPKFDRVSSPDWFSERLRSFVDREGYLRTFPHRHHMDSFFAVCLKRFNEME